MKNEEKENGGGQSKAGENGGEKASAEMKSAENIQPSQYQPAKSKLESGMEWRKDERKWLESEEMDVKPKNNGGYENK